jgi:hypothetical protein
MRDLDGRYILTAKITDALGRRGFWFSDYRYETELAAWWSPDWPLALRFLWLFIFFVH